MTAIDFALVCAGLGALCVSVAFSIRIIWGIKSTPTNLRARKSEPLDSNGNPLEQRFNEMKNMQYGVPIIRSPRRIEWHGKIPTIKGEIPPYKKKEDK